MSAPYRTFKKGRGKLIWWVDYDKPDGSTAEHGPFHTQEQAAEFGRNCTGYTRDDTYNVYQKTMFEAYGGMEEGADPADLVVDDPLFDFMISELGTDKGCGDWQTAINRMEIAIKQLYAVASALSVKGGIEKTLYLSSD